MGGVQQTESRARGSIDRRFSSESPALMKSVRPSLSTIVNACATSPASQTRAAQQCCDCNSTRQAEHPGAAGDGRRRRGGGAGGENARLSVTTHSLMSHGMAAAVPRSASTASASCTRCGRLSHHGLGTLRLECGGRRRCTHGWPHNVENPPTRAVQPAVIGTAAKERWHHPGQPRTMCQESLFSRSKKYRRCQGFHTAHDVCRSSLAIAGTVNAADSLSPVLWESLSVWEAGAAD